MQVLRYEDFTVNYRSRVTGRIESIALECPRCRREIEPLATEGSETLCKCGVYLKREGSRLLVSPATEAQAA